MLSHRRQTQKTMYVSFQLQEVLEQAKLRYGGRNQICG